MTSLPPYRLLSIVKIIPSVAMRYHRFEYDACRVIFNKFSIVSKTSKL